MSFLSFCSAVVECKFLLCRDHNCLWCACHIFKDVLLCLIKVNLVISFHHPPVFTLVRDGPLDITGGGEGKFRCRNVFLRPTCLQEFFFCDTSSARIFFSPTDSYLSFFATHLTFTQELPLISLLLYYFISQICSLD